MLINYSGPLAKTRQEYLNKHWRPYPTAAFLESGEWLCGKVATLGPQSLTLDFQNSTLSLAGLQPVEHKDLGVSLPIAFLALGDSVAFFRQYEAFGGPFLLSPCLQDSKNTFAQNLKWQQFLESTRDFFRSRGFQHWTTPCLVPSSGVDAHIDFMSVKGIRTGRQFFLPTSPEFELKKAMALGARDVFEIKSSFRDDDKSPIHRAEFTMLEWYRSYSGKWRLFEDFEALLQHVQPLFGTSAPFSRNLKKSSMAELFAKHLGFALTPNTRRDELAAALTKRALHWTESDDWDDLFFRLYIECVEPHLGFDGPVAIYDFPATQSSLAQKTASGWSDRFEIYWQGVELANAYQEQNNPSLVREKVNSEITKRRALNRIPHQKDEEFLCAMEAGFPPAAGIALGLDRLFMLLSEHSEIFKPYT